MDRKVIVFTTFIVAFFVLVSVYVQFTGEDARRKQSVPEEETTRPFAGKKVTVLTNHPHLKVADYLAELFSAQSGAAVENVVVNYSDMLDYTLNDISGPNPRLDVVMLWYVDLGVLVENGALIDLTDFIIQNEQTLRPADFIHSIYDPYTLYNGRRWAVPYDGDTHVLFYRKSLLEKYRIKPPATWDEYLIAARTITENEKQNGVFGTAIMAPPVPMIIISSFMNRLGCYGGRLLDDRGRPALEQPEAIDALTALVEHCRYALPSPLETDWEVSRDAFLSGKVAMVEQWTDIGIMAEDPTQSIIQGDWGVIQMPRGRGPGASNQPALNSGFSLAVSKKALHPRMALAYLLFASRPDITLKLNLINGGIDPVRISVLNSREYRNFAPQLSLATRSAIQGATAWPRLKSTPRLLDILAKKLTLAIEGKKTPEEALHETQVLWNKILDNDPVTAE